MSNLHIKPVHERLSQEVINEFGNLSTTVLADAMGRFNGMVGMRHFNNADVQLVGQALTVKTIPGDNLMIHKAIDTAVPGDIIVIQGGGDISRALLGDIMCTLGQKNRIAGYVVDGAIRDAEDIRKMGFPVFAKGVNPNGPFKEGPGQINVNISCAGVSVNPGDIIVGDNDGVVVIPYEQALEVLKRAKAIQEYEQDTFKQIEAGTIDRNWIDEAIKNKGLAK